MKERFMIQTTPIMMVLGLDPEFIDAYMDHTFSLPRPLVETHKRVLGRQMYCIQGSAYRQWVWEYREQGCVIFVSNTRGA